MDDNHATDYYDLLQVSQNAEPETINRVFRLLAQRLHPDNQQTGDEDRFRTILEAYSVLSDPEKRAQYDVNHHQRRHEHRRLVETADQIENDFELEQIHRLSVLEALYANRRLKTYEAGISLLELEELIGRPREHLEFTIWFLQQKRFIMRDDHSLLTITVDGVEYLEQGYQTKVQRKRLQSGNEE